MGLREGDDARDASAAYFRSLVGLVSINRHCRRKIPRANERVLIPRVLPLSLFYSNGEKHVAPDAEARRCTCTNKRDGVGRFTWVRRMWSGCLAAHGRYALISGIPSGSARGHAFLSPPDCFTGATSS